MKKPEQFSLVPPDLLRKIRIIATDVDDTLTRSGKIPSDIVKALENIAASGVDVILVTGRSFGWGLAEKCYLPVKSVIAENGGVLIRDHRSFGGIYFHEGRSLDDFENIRERMKECFRKILERFPDIRESSGNVARITDYAFPANPGTDYSPTHEIAAQFGFYMYISSVAGHITIPSVSKGEMLRHLLREDFGIDSFPSEEILTIGDSTNDAALFDSSSFVLSVGVANVAKYLPDLGDNAPAFITKGEAADGFLEVASALLKNRSYEK